MRPLDLDTERHIINTVLQDEEKRPEIFLKLKPDHFQDIICRMLYSAALELHLAGKAVDVFSAARAGNVADYHEFLELYFPHTISLSAAVKILQDRHDRHRLQVALKDGAILLNDEQRPLDELRSTLSGNLFKALQVGTEATEEHPADIALAIYEKAKTGGKLAGVPSGFNDLDRETGGFDEGTLSILGGRSGHGKTTLAHDIFYYTGTHDRPCLYISLEAPSSETFLFLLQKNAGLAPLKIKSGHLDTIEEKRLKASIEYLKSCAFYFYNSSSRLDDVLLKARSMAQSKKIKLLIVDYVQLVENQIKGEPRHLQVAGVSRALKRLAMDTGLAVVALSQLNKGPEDRNGKIHLSDVRESEAITHDADHVIFINRPSMYGEDGKDFIELAKNRHGQRIDRIPVTWNSIKNTYLDLNPISI